MKNLTPNQSKIVDSLIEEFKQMNTTKVSSSNPLVPILEELQSDKSFCDEQNKVAKARVKMLRLEIESNLQKLSDYFDELGFELEPVWQETGRYYGHSLSYRIRGEEMIKMHGFIDYSNKRVGEYNYECKHNIKYEMGLHSSFTYDSIESLIESTHFTCSVSSFLKALIKEQQDA
jgi:predicted hydrocarbon binding protein